MQKLFLFIILLLLIGAGCNKPEVSEIQPIKFDNAPQGIKLGAGKKMGVPEFVTIGGQNVDKNVIITNIKNKRTNKESLTSSLNPADDTDLYRLSVVLENHFDKCNGLEVQRNESFDFNMDELLNILEEGC